MKLPNPLKSGILTGTTFALIPNLDWLDIIRTIILAAIGAVISGLVSYLLHLFVRKLPPQKPP